MRTAFPTSAGSSPRVRGTQSDHRGRVFRDRFIPACAGNTEPRVPASIDGAVHPRVCGEHPQSGATFSSYRGSSPRVRGTHYAYGRKQPRRRFIPACAGNTRFCSARASACAVHPRVCGEHSTGGERTWTSGGSSPRVRGTPRPVAPANSRGRFIPACAGNTSTTGTLSSGYTVHPRVCGEHSTLPGDFCSPNGSSPRVRGTPGERHDVLALDRFIPACAGNTTGTGWRISTPPVHPRVCGEHSAGLAQPR